MPSCKLQAPVVHPPLLQPGRLTRRLARATQLHHIVPGAPGIHSASGALEHIGWQRLGRLMTCRKNCMHSWLHTSTSGRNNTALAVRVPRLTQRLSATPAAHPSRSQRMPVPPVNANSATQVTLLGIGQRRHLGRHVPRVTALVRKRMKVGRGEGKRVTRPKQKRRQADWRPRQPPHRGGPRGPAERIVATDRTREG